MNCMSVREKKSFFELKYSIQITSIYFKIWRTFQAETTVSLYVTRSSRTRPNPIKATALI